jgi:hypothetical protein
MLLREAVLDGGAVDVDDTRAGKIGPDAPSKHFRRGALSSLLPLLALTPIRARVNSCKRFFTCTQACRRRRMELFAVYRLVLGKRGENQVLASARWYPSFSGQAAATLSFCGPYGCAPMVCHSGMTACRRPSD